MVVDETMGGPPQASIYPSREPAAMFVGWTEVLLTVPRQHNHSSWRRSPVDWKKTQPEKPLVCYCLLSVYRT